MTALNRLRRSNKYRLLGLVGQGQFGQVFCAIHRKTGQLVALKNLDHARFPTHKFLRELRFLLSLQHPHIVNCQALEHTATGRYLVMDYCEAGTLRNLIDYETPLSLAQKLELITHVLAGLQHAHERGIIHCDIKPENILLSIKPGGWIARISDFGIARVTQNDSLVSDGNTGSPAYMAPERFYGQYSEFSDLYAVGVLLYELLLGLRPFSGTPQELMLAHMNQHLVIADSIPADLRHILQSALQKIPARRFRSAAAMLAAVQAVDRQQQVGQDPKRPLDDLDNDHWVSRWTLPPTPISTSTLQTSIDPILAIATTTPPLRSAPTPLPLHWLLAATSTQLWGWGLAADSAEDLTTQQHFQLTMPRSHQIQALVGDTTGCFITTTQAISFLPWPGQPDQDPARSPQPRAQVLMQLEHPHYAAIYPAGRWAAAFRLGSGPAPQFTICQWRWQTATPALQVRTVTLPGQPDGSGPKSRQPQQLLPLDSHHFTLMSRLPGASSPKTQFDIYSRRGKYLGHHQVDVPLYQVIPTRSPYQFLALEQGYPEAILLLTLKPWRVQRRLLPLPPVCYAATPWGYVIATADGQILVFNDWFELVGRLAGPPTPTAIASFNSHYVLITTATPSHTLYTVNLRNGDIDLIF